MGMGMQKVNIYKHAPQQRCGLLYCSVYCKKMSHSHSEFLSWHRSTETLCWRRRFVVHTWCCVHNAHARVMEAENCSALTIYSSVNWSWVFTYEYTSLPGPWIHNQDYKVTKHYTCGFLLQAASAIALCHSEHILWSSCLGNVSQLYAGSDITNCLTYRISANRRRPRIDATLE